MAVTGACFLPRPSRARAGLWAGGGMNLPRQCRGPPLPSAGCLLGSLCGDHPFGEAQAPAFPGPVTAPRLAARRPVLMAPPHAQVTAACAASREGQRGSLAPRSRLILEVHPRRGGAGDRTVLLSEQAWVAAWSRTGRGVRCPSSPSFWEPRAAVETANTGAGQARPHGVRTNGPSGPQ